MFEKRHEKILTRREFSKRILQRIGLLTPIVLLSLGVGMLGYHGLETMGWVDAFFNASMIMSGMGPATDMQTDAGKIFAGLYAIYSGLFLIAVMGYLLIPFFHRMMHMFHQDK